MDIKTLFPAYRLSKVDYLLGGLLLLFCYFSFFQSDIIVTGWNSLNFIFGNPLEFYENCKKVQGQGVRLLANYPPSLFLIFALWLYPFKLFGLLKTPFYFSPYLVYWLKALTTLVYGFTGLIFYQVTQIYSTNKAWGTYATWLWITSPLAIFSQFIFSQYDIFYVFLTLTGFLFFLKKNIFLASFLFGLAITFKYFPFFVFIPLLLFFEKKFFKIFLCGIFFLAPMLLIQSLYGHSPAYVEGVMGFSAIGRVFLSFLNVGGLKVYYIFSIFTIISGICYFLNVKENDKNFAAYIFLFTSIFPFLFIMWHPQWLLFITAPIMLTSALYSEESLSKFLFFDLMGMIVFVAFNSLIFQNNVDLTMFQGQLFNIHFDSIYSMGSLFKIFKGFSANVYFSIFWGYLVLQCILKSKLLLVQMLNKNKNFYYKNIRIRYYMGIFIFLIPAGFLFFLNYKSADILVLNIAQDKIFGELIAGRTFEQIFIAKERNLKQVDLFLATFSRVNSKDIQLEILENNRKKLAIIKRSAINVLDNGWESFKFPSLQLQKGKTYLLRLTSPNSIVGNAITWCAATKPSYSNGHAIVDGVSQQADFSFKLRFEKT
ncbi:MAG: glycosyltransferase family 87 protein [Candidatus Aquirickettsiella sp.]